MKFLPAVLLDGAMFEALVRGQLRLQVGQWVRIPGDQPGRVSKPSRFVSAGRGYVNVVHPNGPFASGKVSMGVFRARCLAAKG